MLDIEQLAQVRSLSIKISHLLGEIEALPRAASASGRQSLNRRLAQLNDQLAASLPEDVVADRELMSIILHPPKGLWLSLNRREIVLKTISQWIDVMNDDVDLNKQHIAELKLLFFFGSQEALKVFLTLHSKYTWQQNSILQLLS